MVGPLVREGGLWALGVRDDEGPAAELRREPEGVSEAVSMWPGSRLVLGLFSGRSGCATGSASEGEVVADFRFLFGVGSRSISFAFSRAFHARISSRDSGSGR